MIFCSGHLNILVHECFYFHIRELRLIVTEWSACLWLGSPVCPHSRYFQQLSLGWGESHREWGLKSALSGEPWSCGMPSCHVAFDKLACAGVYTVQSGVQQAGGCPGVDRAWCRVRLPKIVFLFSAPSWWVDSQKDLSSQDLLLC